ncbi:MAG TPA: FlgD immunoglobulin-like domain containing protein, partial [Planctomycetota bacterium]|nr:FlgD immunoglobulin-like domain containing protein [Planctomycetota bacterium]
MRFLPRIVSAYVLGVAAISAADPAPLRIPVTCSVPGKGLASVALYDRDGVLVRTLLAAAPVEVGKREVVWDGTDDLGRPVAAGTYSPKGIFFPTGPSLNWVMKVGKSGNPPWTTADGSGNWGGNLAHPASITSNGTDVVMVQGCVEDGVITGVQQMDAEGAIKLRYHTFYPWDSRSASAMDVKNLYLGILNWGSGLEIAEYKLGEPRGRILTKLPSKMVKTPIGRWKYRAMNNLDGLAITDDRIYASVAVTDELFIIERASGKILKQVALPKPYGVAVSNGRLLVVSDTQVLTYSLEGERQGVLVPTGTLTAPNALCVGADGTVYVGDSGRIAIDIEWEGGTKQIHAFSATGKPLRRIGKAGGAPRGGRFDSTALGDITGICIAPGGKSLMVTDVATGFQRTSRWSLDGKLEREWFCRKLECWSDVRNPARPDELVKIGGAFDDELTAQAWEIDFTAKTWHPAWHYTMPFAQCWQDDVVVGFGHGG